MAVYILPQPLLKRAVDQTRIYLKSRTAQLICKNINDDELSGDFITMITRNSWARSQIFSLNRFIICTIVVVSIGTLFLQPVSLLANIFDILLRAYLIFIGTVMAHEAVHGHLGRTKAANFWWGRVALLPSMVPFTNFRKTHHLHHAYTNIPTKDPDYFMRSRNGIELILRALAMPHQWFYWLWKRNYLKKDDLIELIFNYFLILAIYSAMLVFISPSRLFWGMLPSLIIVSILLWYPFAVQTHEGFSTGAAELRSHNYYGRFMYWFSLGLSIHREHHLQPKLSWIELKDYVEEAPSGLGKWSGLPQRDIKTES